MSNRIPELRRRRHHPPFSDEEWTCVSVDLKLSGRELQILQGICDDLKEAVIALRLGISSHTVRTHRERLYRKLNVNSTPAMLVRVFESFMNSHVNCRVELAGSAAPPWRG